MNGLLLAVTIVARTFIVTQCEGIRTTPEGPVPVPPGGLVQSCWSTVAGESRGGVPCSLWSTWPTLQWTVPDVGRFALDLELLTDDGTLYATYSTEATKFRVMPGQAPCVAGSGTESRVVENDPRRKP